MCILLTCDSLPHIRVAASEKLCQSRREHNQSSCPQIMCTSPRDMDMHRTGRRHIMRMDFLKVSTFAVIMHL